MTILVVDDESESRRLLVDILKAEGYEVRPADNGQIALASVMAQPPDLILLDIRMPDVDGFAVVEGLREDPGTAGIPVVVLTSKSMTAEEKARLNGRIIHLARKSDFNRAELLALIRRLCPAAA